MKNKFSPAVFLFCSIEFVGALPFLSDVLSFFWPGGPLSSFKLPLILLVYIIAAVDPSVPRRASVFPWELEAGGSSYVAPSRAVLPLSFLERLLVRDHFKSV